MGVTPGDDTLWFDDDPRVVAMLRLPMPVKPLAKAIKALVKVHGDELRMEQHLDWLVFRAPEPGDTPDTRAARSGTTPQ